MNDSLNDPQGPVFVVGMNGSGTTMMLDHLSSHPKLFGFRIETYVLPWFLSRVHKYGDLALDANFLRLWDDMRSAYPFRASNGGVPVELPEDWNAGPRHAGSVFDRIMGEFASRAGKSRWCEKTPVHVLHMTRIAGELPDARFIHMIRDGRDCAVSCYRRWKRHPNGTMLRWKQVIIEGRRQGRLLPGRYIEVRYEDITSDPAQQMRKVCTFLGVEFDESVLSVGRPRKRQTGQDSKTIVPNRKRSDNYFPDSRMMSLERIAGQQLADLGYANRRPASSTTPSAVARLWWTIYDAWYTLSRHVRYKMTIDRHMSWSLFFSRLMTILRSKI